MECPRCTSENPEGTSFCVACGSSLDTKPAEGQERCNRCGEYNPAIALYCEHCGQLLVAAPEIPEGLGPSRDREEETSFPPREVIGLVSESYMVFRQNPLAFVTIVLIAHIPALISTVSSSTVVFLIILPFSLVMAALAQGAMVHGVVQGYLGQPVRIGECFNRAWKRLISLVVASVVLGAASVGPGLLLGLTVHLALGAIWLPVMLLILVRWFFFTQAIMVESYRNMGSLSRSHELVGHDGWRVLGIAVVFILAFLGVTILLTVPGQLVEPAAPILGRILLTATGIVTVPFIWIGATVVYFDLRVRQGGYDRKRLAEEVGHED